MAPIRGIGRAIFGPGRQPIRELGAGIRQAFGQMPGSAMAVPDRARMMRAPMARSRTPAFGQMPDAAPPSPAPVPSAVRVQQPQAPDVEYDVTPPPIKLGKYLRQSPAEMFPMERGGRILEQSRPVPAGATVEAMGLDPNGRIRVMVDGQEGQMDVQWFQETASPAPGNPKEKPKDAPPAPPGEDWLSVQGTRYGYKGDPYRDPNSSKGIGNRQNVLHPRRSVALKESTAAKLGVNIKAGDRVSVMMPDGVSEVFTVDDTIPESSGGNDRIDFYDPTGLRKSIDGAGLRIRKAPPEEKVPADLRILGPVTKARGGYKSGKLQYIPTEFLEPLPADPARASVDLFLSR